MTEEQDVTLEMKIGELKSEHRALDKELHDIGSDPSIDDLQIRRLKKRKLFLKDSITHLESRLVPDITA
jgi:hypothetical protein